MKFTYKNPSTGLMETKDIQYKMILHHKDGKKLYIFSDKITITPDALNVAGDLMCELPENISQEFDFKSLESSISAMTIEATNGNLSNGQKLSEYIYEHLYSLDSPLLKAKVEIFLEKDYNSISKTDEIIYTGYLQFARGIDIYETSYVFEIEDITREIKKQIFSDALDANKTVIENIPSGVYGTFSKLARKQQDGATGAITGIINHVESTDQATINTWSKPDRWFVLRYVGHPIDFARDIIIQTAGADAFDNASFETVKINTKNQIINTFDYIIKEPIEDALEYIRTQCLMPCYAFYYIGLDGKIYLKQLEQPTSAVALTVFNESNTIDILGNSTDTSNIVNFATCKFDYNEEDDKYNSIAPNFDDNDVRNSIEIFGILPESFDIEIQGLNRNANLDVAKEAFCAELTNYIFNRCSISLKIIEISVFSEYAKNKNIGDFVIFENSKIIDWKRISPNLGKRGTTDADTYTIAVIDASLWGDYTNTYKNNDCFSDAQFEPTQDAQSGKLKWDYKWYIKKVENKFAEYIPQFDISDKLPLGGENFIDTALISMKTFNDMLLNYKINRNFLEFHNADI